MWLKGFAKTIFWTEMIQHEDFKKRTVIAIEN